MSSIIEGLIKAAFENKASDIFLSEGSVARMKVNGQLMIAGEDSIEKDVEPTRNMTGTETQVTWLIMGSVSVSIFTDT